MTATSSMPSTGSSSGAGAVSTTAVSSCERRTRVNDCVAVVNSQVNQQSVSPSRRTPCTSSAPSSDVTTSSGPTAHTRAASASTAECTVAGHPGTSVSAVFVCMERTSLDFQVSYDCP